MASKRKAQPRSKRELIIDSIEDRPGRARPGRGAIQDGLELEGMYVEFTPNGLQIREAVKIFGLDPERWTRDVLNTPGLPKPYLGDTHSVFTSVPCTRTSATQIDDRPDGALVTMEYGTGEGGFFGLAPIEDADRPELEINSRIESLQTNMHYVGDNNDNLVPIVLRDMITTPVEEGGTGEPVEITRGATVQTGIALTDLIYRRREKGLRVRGPLEGLTPGDIARLYVGSLNKTELLERPGEPGTGDPPYSWMCTAIAAVSTDGAETWSVVYQFSHHPLVYDTPFGRRGGWCAVASILDGEGNPHPDATTVGDGTLDNPGGRAFVRVHRAMEFDNLELYI
jgi:hypothetical protein